MRHFKKYCYDYVNSYRDVKRERIVGGMDFHDDASMNKLRLQIQLEETSYWFLSVYARSNNQIDYSLDYEAASDSHYEFSDERSIRDALYKQGDELLYLHEVFIRFLKIHKGWDLYEIIKPYIIAEYHFD